MHYQERIQIDNHEAKVSECDDNYYWAKKSSDCEHNGFSLQAYRFQKQEALQICYKFI